MLEVVLYYLFSIYGVLAGLALSLVVLVVVETVRLARKGNQPKTLLLGI